MKTYQDLLNTNDVTKFIPAAVISFTSSDAYHRAQEGERYYAKHNGTIEDYVKKLYTLSGEERADIFSANYKIKSLIFRRLVTQLVQYVLGNGVVLPKKERLGKGFDNKLQKAGKHALAAGTAFLFWNLDHVEAISYVNTPAEPGFCPLYDEYTGELMAGIRFYSKPVGNNTLWFYTLYEPDGYTEFSGKDGRDLRVVKEKRPYIIRQKKTSADGILEEIGENYTALPIVPLYSNDTRESELIGLKEAIDAYDLIKSGFANEIDDTSGVYWMLTNTGAMEDPDIAKLWQRLKTSHGMVLEDDADVELQTVNVPVEARKTMLEILRKDIYEDAQMLDVSTLSAAAKTTQEIQAAYQAQDNHAADFEYQVLDALYKLFAIIGITDEPTFVWQKVINMQEQTNIVLQAANYLSDECIIRHLPFLTPEEIESEIKKMEDREITAFSESINNEETEDTAGTEDNQDIRRS